MHDIWQEERKRVIENRGKPPPPPPPPPPPKPQATKPKTPTPQKPEHSTLTRIKSPNLAPNAGLCPEPVLSVTSRTSTLPESTKKRQFLFSNDKDLEDLDDDIFDDFNVTTPTPKRSKIDSKESLAKNSTPDTVIIEQSVDNSSPISEMNQHVETPSAAAETNISQNSTADTTFGDFSFSFPETSTQIESHGNKTSSKPCSKSTDLSTSDTSPILSTKTLSKLRAFAAPAAKDDLAEKSSRTCFDEGNGTSVVGKSDDKDSTNFSAANKNTTKPSFNRSVKDSAKNARSVTSKLAAFAATLPAKNVNPEDSSKTFFDEGNGTSIVDKSDEKDSTNLTVVNKNSTESVERKSFFDEGNGSSIIEKDQSLVDRTKKSPPPKNDTKENRPIFAEMSAKFNLDVERQRSLLASVFSDHNSDNFDDLDF